MDEKKIIYLIIAILGGVGFTALLMVLDKGYGQLYWIPIVGFLIYKFLKSLDK